MDGFDGYNMFFLDMLDILNYFFEGLKSIKFKCPNVLYEVKNNYYHISSGRRP